MSEPRKAELSVIYEGSDISDRIGDYIEEFSYTDVASGESDRISLRLDDTDQKWMGPWMPGKGDRIGSTILFSNWFEDGARDKLYCGEFEIDELTFSGRPFLCRIGAVSIPQDSAFNAEERTKTWENATIELIAGEIAERAGVGLHYEGETIGIENIEQNGQTDCGFLYALCESYGFAMKVFADKIIIFDEEIYEKAQAATVLYEPDMISWEYRTDVAGTYTGASFSFTDPNDEEERTVTIGGGDRILKINVTADNIRDAERKGTAMLNNENKKSTTMSIKMKSNPGIVAGSCVMLEKFGGLDGKYYADRVVTSLSGRGATQISLSLRRVVDRIKAESAQAAEGDGQEGTDYEIRPGDTLWMIAETHLGDPMRYTEIYQNNRDVLENAAKQHGKSSTENGHWIYPGTVIKIPAE